MEDDDYDMFGKLKPFSSKGPSAAAGRIPWFRGQTFSFSTVSGDVGDDLGDADGLESMASSHYAPSLGPRASILRSSLGSASKQLYSSSGRPIPSAAPQAVYPHSTAASAGHNNNHCSNVEVNSIALSANGSVSLVGHSDGRVTIVHTADGARGDFTQHASGKAIRQVAISADGKVGASACLDGTVRVFETDTLVQVALLRQTGFAWANGVALSADGRVVIASFTPRYSDRGKIVRYDWAERRVIALWTGFSKVFELAVDKHAEKIAFIRQGGTIAVLAAPVNTDTPAANRKNKNKTPAPAIAAQYKYMKGDLDMAMDAQGNNLLIADKTLRYHRVRSSCSDLLPDYKPHKVRKVALTADGTRSAETRKNNVIIRQLDTHAADCGTIALALRHKHKITTLNISADGTTIFAADAYANLVLWRPDTLPKTNTNLVEGKYFASTDSNDLRDVRSCLADDVNLSPISRYLSTPSSPVSPMTPTQGTKASNSNSNDASPSPKRVPPATPIIPPKYEEKYEKEAVNYKEQPPLDELKLDLTPQRPIARLDTPPLEVVSMKGGICVAPSPSPRTTNATTNTPLSTSPERRRRSHYNSNSSSSGDNTNAGMYRPPAYPPPHKTLSSHSMGAAAAGTDDRKTIITQGELQHNNNIEPQLAADPHAVNAAFHALSDAFTSVETAVPYYDMAGGSAPNEANNYINNSNNYYYSPTAAVADANNEHVNDSLFVSVESMQLAQMDIPNNMLFTSVESVTIPPTASNAVEEEEENYNGEEIFPPDFDIQRVESHAVGDTSDNEEEEESLEKYIMKLEALPSKGKLNDTTKEDDDTFPAAAPCFPVLEPEMAGASTILRDARK